MRVWFIATAATCALLSACGQTTTPPGDTTATSTEAPNADAKFLAAAAMYENYQIQAAELAATHAGSQAVKTYAANATTAHRAALQSLTQAAQASGMPAPSAELNADYQAYIDRLRANDPTPFDVRYISEQTLTTMSMAGRYDAFTSIAPDSALKQWATRRSQAVHDDITAAHHLAATTH